MAVVATFNGHETPPSFIPEKLAQEGRKNGRSDISKSNPSALPVC
jgi:hypothetical protein